MPFEANLKLETSCPICQSKLLFLKHALYEINPKIFQFFIQSLLDYCGVFLVCQMLKISSVLGGFCGVISDH